MARFEPLFILLRKWYNKVGIRSTNRGVNSAEVFFSSNEMYEIDQYTINTIGIPSPVLIERAAYSVVFNF